MRNPERGNYSGANIDKLIDKAKENIKMISSGLNKCSGVDCDNCPASDAYHGSWCDLTIGLIGLVGMEGNDEANKRSREWFRRFLSLFEAKIKAGDTVKAICGNPKGLTGVVVKTLCADNPMYTIKFEGWTRGHSACVNDGTTDKWNLYRKDFMFLHRASNGEPSKPKSRIKIDTSLSIAGQAVRIANIKAFPNMLADIFNSDLMIKSMVSTMKTEYNIYDDVLVGGDEPRLPIVLFEAVRAPRIENCEAVWPSPKK